MRNKILYFASFFLGLGLIANSTALLLDETRLQQQQRQIDQLCLATTSVMCDEPRTFENCEFYNLEPGMYVMCFPNYGDKSAVLQYPYYLNIKEYSKKETRPDYIYTHGLPWEMLKDWKIGESLYLPANKSPH